MAGPLIQPISELLPNLCKCISVSAINFSIALMTVNRPKLSSNKNNETNQCNACFKTLAFALAS